MQVQFWGTRGSIAKPGPSTARYGGNTSCVEVRSARGTLVVIDCGTGAHALGQKLLSEAGKGLRGRILISHTHWDHIQGIPFFAPLFVPGSQWDIYGPKGLDQSLRETLAGQMQYTYFPVTPDQFAASIRYHDLVEGSFEIDDIKITTRYLNHPALTLGYRLEADGATLVYACDHEPHSRNLASGEGEIAGQDLRHAEFIDRADLLIHDAQYTAVEYPSKVGWGHSSVEYAVRLAEHAKVKRLALTHHDPLRDDAAIDRVIAGIRAGLKASSSPLDVFAAAEGELIQVKPSHAQHTEASAAGFSATAPIEPALADRSVLLGIADPSVAAMLSDAVKAEGIRANFFSGIDEVKALIGKNIPSLVIIEQEKPGMDAMTACRAIRQMKDDEIPVVMVAAEQGSNAGTDVCVTDWLIKPFTAGYARTKIRAWVLRTACRWVRAAMPADEAQRVCSLHDLRVLDTAAEERFDRITRLAAALFDVPMAVISLVDANRQWFKSRVGVDFQETPRDDAFCSHVVYNRTLMIVPDALADARFAQNPLVISGPRLRFYAGYPLILEDGSCIGTLCLMDSRPRTLAGPDLQRLHDLADMALHEFQSVTAHTAH